MYHYVLTLEYPYTIGCFRGTPVRANFKATQQRQMQREDTPLHRAGPRRRRPR